MYLTWTVNSTSKAHSVLSYCLFQSSRDFACHLMHKLYTRMQQGPKLMLKYSATLLDKAMWCWQFSQITVRYTGRYNQALYTIQNKIIYIFFLFRQSFLIAPCLLLLRCLTQASTPVQISKGLLMLKGNLMGMLAKRPCLCSTIPQTIPWFSRRWERPFSTARSLLMTQAEALISSPLSQDSWIQRDW